MGDRVGFDVGCFVNGFGGLTIGDGTSFGPCSMIHTAKHNTDDPDLPVADQGWREERPLEIGRNCRIGMGALILPGVRIGDGCVLGAGAVLTKDLDDYTIAVGNPAKPTRRRR